MAQAPTNTPAPTDSHDQGQIERSPVLLRLGLSTAEIAALSAGGTISREVRGRRTIVFKLRFRLAGQQRVKYLGTDAALAAQIGEAVLELQRPARGRRRVQRIEQQARALLRTTKRQLELPLREGGLKFHGYAIRRSRNPVTVPLLS